MRPTALIGHTGFIGGNLARQFAFDECYNSKNIPSIRGKEFFRIVCGGVSAVKWWANQNPAEDRAKIDELLADLATVKAGKMIVLSTVDVYPVVSGVDESFDCHSQPNHAYGTNRLYFEDSLKQMFADVLILRISGVFGPGLKKNVIYDLIHDNQLNVINPDSSFQYYNVGNLWRDLAVIETQGLDVVNLVNEPVLTSTIVERLFPGKLVGANPMAEAHYDIHTLHSASGPYRCTAEEVLRELGDFIAQ